MNEETRTMQTADTTPDRAPEDAPALVKKIGKTTYKVRVHFSNTSTETMSDKIKRMSRSKKWRLEWAFFLGENGRRQYNKLCKGCVHPCKQSFRAVVVS